VLDTASSEKYILIISEIAGQARNDKRGFGLLAQPLIEKNIVNSLKENGKTVILIAHRLGTVMTADKIFVLQNGVLVEQGTHNELIANDSQYAKFWNIQTRGIDS
jgi:ABC-type cobalamin transport system ATPase subunit